jgi:hypothetical protein
MAAADRAESVRRLVELTGLGIAATYFFDPEHGAGRRRAAREWIAGAVADRRVATVSAPAEPAPEPAPVPAEEPAPVRDEVVVVTTAPAPPAWSLAQETQWPRWGWALVLTITLCAIAATAAVGIGIWAIESGSSTVTVTTATVPAAVASAAQVLADPTAQRVTGSAPTGTVVLRVGAAGSALAVAGLPPPANDVYRVWVDASGTTTRAAAFTGTSALVWIRTPLSSGDRVTITREHAGAVGTAPHGPRVASVTVSP